MTNMNRTGLILRRTCLASAAGLAVAATACVEPPYRNEVSVANQGGGVTIRREPKPPELPPPAPPPPVVIYLPATAPAPAETPPTPPNDAAARQLRIEQLEAHMRQEQTELERLKAQPAPSATPTTAPSSAP